MSEYIFVQGLDSINGDISRNENLGQFKSRMSIKEEELPEEVRKSVCFNTLGYYKSSVNELRGSPYFGENDGLYIKDIVNGFPIRVINLDRRPDRWEKIKGDLNKAGLKNYTRFSAVDGTKLQMNEGIKHLFRGNDFNYRQGVVGCALSHIKLWTELVSSPYEYMIIMEDDIELIDNFKSKLNVSLHQLLQKPFIDLMFLGYSYWQGRPAKLNNYPMVKSIEIPSYMGGFYGYVIGKVAAMKYLHIMKYLGIQNGIDRFAHIHFNKLVVCNTEPHLIYTEVATGNNGTDSDIQRNFNSIGVKALDETLDDTKTLVSSKVSSEAKTKVKLICNWTTSKELCKYWDKMTQGNGVWNDMQITSDNNADYFVIINKPGPPEYYDPKKTIIFQMEPWVKDESKKWGVKTWGKWAKPDPKVFYKVLTHSVHHNLGEWHLNKTYKELLEFKPEKSKMLSTFVSDKNYDEGHIKRLEFLKYIEDKGNDFVIDIYGKGSTDYKNGKGPVEHKDEGLFPYKYTLCVENNSEHNYITEKLYDGILAECLCFYWGCPNLEDYIDSKAFIRINLDNFEEAYETISKAIENNEWESRIEHIRSAKTKILNEMSIMPCIEKAIKSIGFKEPKIIYYTQNGRFTNALFQYFAAEIIRDIYGYDKVEIFNGQESGLNKVSNLEYKSIVMDYIKEGKKKDMKNKSFIIDGFFQFSEIFKHYRDYIKSIFNTNNSFKFYQDYSIKDLVDYKLYQKHPGDNDLVMHIRLDDFRGDNQIFEPSMLKDIIKNVKYDKLYIVCDEIRQVWEKEYMNSFSEFNPVMINGGLLEDFKYIMSSKKLLISASTYSWMSAYLNDDVKEVHIPYNTFHGESQDLGSFSDKCKVYTDVKYMKF
jgi:GR25 family glycosyltransferase involved in LPS biosynthesis